MGWGERGGGGRRRADYTPRGLRLILTCCSSVSRDTAIAWTSFVSAIASWYVNPTEARL